MEPKRVLVCGGRDFDDGDLVFSVLDEIRPAVVIEGAASGADHHAHNWAINRGRLNETYAANWRLHGKGAGPLRNQRMIDEGKPDLVVAFPGGRGTADMVRRAKAAGIPVREVPAPSGGKR